MSEVTGSKGVEDIEYLDMEAKKLGMELEEFYHWVRDIESKGGTISKSFSQKLDSISHLFEE